MLVFLDLETTGLDPNKHAVLEVACIITDDKLIEIARSERVIARTAKFHECDEFIRNMHTVNGLWKAIGDAWRTGDYHDLDAVDAHFSDFIREHAVRIYQDDKGRSQVDRPQLAGNTISFDRAFLKVHLPRTEAELHYRNLDVSSFNEMARRFWPGIYESRPKGPNIAHRAMADTEESLRCARYYAETLGPVALKESTP